MGRGEREGVWGRTDEEVSGGGILEGMGGREGKRNDGKRWVLSGKEFSCVFGLEKFFILKKYGCIP